MLISFSYLLQLICQRIFPWESPCLKLCTIWKHLKTTCHWTPLTIHLCVFFHNILWNHSNPYSNHLCQAVQYSIPMSSVEDQAMNLLRKPEDTMSLESGPTPCQVYRKPFTVRPSHCVLSGQEGSTTLIKGVQKMSSSPSYSTLAWWVQDFSLHVWTCTEKIFAVFRDQIHSSAGQRWKLDFGFTHWCSSLCWDFDRLDFSRRFFSWSYWSTGLALFGAEFQHAVQVDVRAFPPELKHVEGEDIGQSHSVPLHHHCRVTWVWTSVQKKPPAVKPGSTDTDWGTVWSFPHPLLIREYCRVALGFGSLVAQQESVTRANRFPSRPSAFSFIQIFWFSKTSVFGPIVLVSAESL